MRRQIVLAAAPACALLVFSPFAARAAETVEIPAPAATASAVALKIGSLLTVSQTGAVAHDENGDPKPSADASVLKLGDQTLLDTGGTQNGVGQDSGVLLDIGVVQVAPWATEVKKPDQDTVESKAGAALVRANVANVVRAALLHSESEAKWTKGKSTSSAFSNGVELDVANVLSVVLLHSEVNSEGNGHSYLVGLNGNEIGTDSSLGQSQLCSLELPSLLSLSCLTADGGAGQTVPGTPREAAAQVAEVDPAIGAIGILDPIGAFTTAGSSGGGAPAVTLPAAPAPAPNVPAAEEVRAPDIISQAPALPRTGAALAGLIVFGLVALLGGAVLRLAGRRRVTA